MNEEGPPNSGAFGVSGGAAIAEKSRYDWRQLRFWRVVGLVSLPFIVIWPLVMVTLKELYDLPAMGHALIAPPVFLNVVALVKITSFECPECHRSFSMHERTGTHLTNKRCVHCGAAIGA